MIDIWLPVRCKHAMVMYVSGSIGWVDRTEEVHVACVAALSACVVRLRAWLREMPKIAVVAQCCMKDIVSQLCFSGIASISVVSLTPVTIVWVPTRNSARTEDVLVTPGVADFTLNQVPLAWSGLQVTV